MHVWCGGTIAKRAPFRYWSAQPHGHGVSWLAGDTWVMNQSSADALQFPIGWGATTHANPVVIKLMIRKALLDYTTREPHHCFSLIG